MYAIKPWSQVALIGGTAGSYAMGIGMRWRETNCVLLEKHPSPSYEGKMFRRCLLSKGVIKLLVDLGCCERKLHGILSPTRGWRILTPQLEELRTGVHFPGSAVGEPSFHCSYGSLVRLLRTEFLRYGGVIEWGSRSGDFCYTNENTVSLSKTYGALTDLSAVVDTTKRISLPEDETMDASRCIGVTKGTVKGDDALKSLLFGTTCDVCILVGTDVAAHCWLQENKLISWRIVERANDGPRRPLDGVFSDLVGRSKTYTAYEALIPDVSKLEPQTGKVCVAGDGLIPIDSFEFRGDNAQWMIREASLLCNEIYRQKYHRGDIGHILPHFSNEMLEKRKSLLTRDCNDLDGFLSWGRAALAYDADAGAKALLGEQVK